MVISAGFLLGFAIISLLLVFAYILFCTYSCYDPFYFCNERVYILSSEGKIKTTYALQFSTIRLYESARYGYRRPWSRQDIMLFKTDNTILQLYMSPETYIRWSYNRNELEIWAKQNLHN